MSRVLLDHNVPRRVRTLLTGHTVDTADDRGWSALANGELLVAAEQAGYEVFVTADQNMRFQQSLARTFATVVLGSNRLSIIGLNADRVAAAVNQAVAGQVSFVAFPIRRSPASGP